MQEITFELTTEYIELNKLLKVVQVAQTGGHANLLIMEGNILLNGMVDTRKRAKVRKGDVVQFEDVSIKIV